MTCTNVGHRQVRPAVRCRRDPLPNTPAGRVLLRQLSDLNNGLCFSMFAEYETQRELDRFSTELDYAYSTELFLDNPHARRIHVRLRDLRCFQDSHRGATLMAYVSASYDAVRAYCDSLPEVAREWGLSVSPRAKGVTPPEESFRKQLLPGINAPPEILRTFEWIRLKRNHWIHGAKVVNASWSRVALHAGPSLNLRWSLIASAIDFTRTDLVPIEPDAAIQMINLLRICATEIDMLVRSSLLPKGMLEYCARLVPGGLVRSSNSDVVVERARKARGIARTEFCARVSLDDAKEAVLAVML